MHPALPGRQQQDRALHFCAVPTDFTQDPLLRSPQMSTHARRRRRSQYEAVALTGVNRRWLAAIAGLLILAVAAYTGYRVISTVHSIAPNASLGDVLAVAENSNPPGSLGYKVEHGERVNILLLGYGGAGHDGAYLTDSIMVLSAQGTDRLAMTSIPRDTYVRVSGALASGRTYQGRINGVYSLPLDHSIAGKPIAQYDAGFQGAGALASKVVGDMLGVKIDYWVGVDFSAFKQLVDAIGGIEVVNPYVLDDPQYPLGETSGYMHIHFDAGPQHLNGDQALIYVRERHADNDFGRSRRQQQVLTAIKDKVVSVGAIPKLFSLLDALQNNVKTNMNLAELRAASGLVNKINAKAAHHVSIDSTNFLAEPPDAASFYRLYLRDRTLGTLHHYIASEMLDPAVIAERSKIELESGPGEGSSYNTLAGTWTALLGMLNLQVTSPGSVSSAPATTEIHDYSGGKARKTVAWLRDYFNGTVITETPQSQPSGGAAAKAPASSATPGVVAGPPDVVVVLGRDFWSSYNQPDPSISSYYSSSTSSSSGSRSSTRPRQSAPTPRSSSSSAPPPPAPSPSKQPCIPPNCIPSPRPSAGEGNSGGGTKASPSPGPTP